MRRRRMSLSEKIFFIEKYYSNGKDWTAVQKDFNREFDVATSQDIEKLIHQVVKRFESTGSVTQDFYFGNDMIFKRELLAEAEMEIIVEEEVEIPAEEVLESNCPSLKLIHEPVTELTEYDEVDRPASTEDLNSSEEEEPQTKEDESSDEEYNPVAEMAAYGCPKCSLSYKTKKALHAHNRIHHKAKPDVICPICGKNLRPSYLAKHLEVHTPIAERPLTKCRKCGEKTDNKKRHMRLCHNMSESMQHICELCGKILSGKKNLECHMRTHTKERPYKCKLCPRDFATLGSLRFHIRVHTNYRPFKCPHCEKAFMDRSTLTVHIRQHTGETPYVCHLCGKACKQAQNLRSHIRHIHTKELAASRQ